MVLDRGRGGTRYRRTCSGTSFFVRTGGGRTERRLFDDSVPVTRLEPGEHTISPVGNAILSYRRHGATESAHYAPGWARAPLSRPLSASSPEVPVAVTSTGSGGPEKASRAREEEANDDDADR